MQTTTNPKRTYTIDKIEEHIEMLMDSHHVDQKIRESETLASSRIKQ